MSNRSIQQKSTQNQPSRAVNCYMLDMDGLHAGLPVEFGTKPAVYTGRREPFNGWERFVSLDDTAWPTTDADNNFVLEAWVRTHKNTGVSFLFGKEKKPGGHVVLVRSGLRGVKATKVDHGITRRGERTKLIEHGTVRARTGAVVSREELVVLPEGGIVAVLFVNGSAAVLWRRRGTLRYRHINAAAVQRFYEWRHRLQSRRQAFNAIAEAGGSDAAKQRRDWGYYTLIETAVSAQELEQTVEVMVNAAGHRDLRPGVMQRLGEGIFDKHPALKLHFRNVTNNKGVPARNVEAGRVDPAKAVERLERQQRRPRKRTVRGKPGSKPKPVTQEQENKKSSPKKGKQERKKAAQAAAQ